MKSCHFCPIDLCLFIIRNSKKISYSNQTFLTESRHKISNLQSTKKDFLYL